MEKGQREGGEGRERKGMRKGGRDRKYRLMWQDPSAGIAASACAEVRMYRP